MLVWKVFLAERFRNLSHCHPMLLNDYKNAGKETFRFAFLYSSKKMERFQVLGNDRVPLQFFP